MKPQHRRIAAAVGVVVAAVLAGCSALPDKPVQQTQYDFGPLTSPPVAGQAAARQPASAPALVLPELQVQGSLDHPSLWYRLAYAEPQVLRPYAYARWSAPPAQLLWQRLRSVLGHDRAVLDEAATASLARRGVSAPLVLRVALEEFSQVFDAPGSSRGVLRLRCTLLENSSGGQRLLAQRSIVVERPAPSPDAVGGAQALAAASEAAAQEIAAWLRER